MQKASPCLPLIPIVAAEHKTRQGFSFPIDAVRVDRCNKPNPSLTYNSISPMAKRKCIEDQKKLVSQSRSRQKVTKKAVSKKTSIREQLGPVSSVKAIRHLVEESANPEQ